MAKKYKKSGLSRFFIVSCGVLFLFLHHFLHAFPSLAVDDVDEVNAGRQIADIHRELFTFAFDRGNALAKGVDDFGLLKVFL